MRRKDNSLNSDTVFRGFKDTDALEKTLMLGKIEEKRTRGRQRVRWLDSVTNSMDMNLSKLREIVEDRGGFVRGCKESDMT